MHQLACCRHTHTRIHCLIIPLDATRRRKKGKKTKPRKENQAIAKGKSLNCNKSTPFPPPPNSLAPASRHVGDGGNHFGDGGGLGENMRSASPLIAILNSSKSILPEPVVSTSETIMPSVASEYRRPSMCLKSDVPMVPVLQKGTARHSSRFVHVSIQLAER